MGPLRAPAAWCGRHPRLARALTAVLLLAAGLALAVLGKNGSTYHTGQWDGASQALVFGRMLQMQQGQSAPGGFMGVYTEEWGDPQNRYLYLDNTPVAAADYHSYTHQSGLQGTVLGALNKLLSLRWAEGEARERRLYTLNSALFYAVSLCLCLAVGRAWGAPAAVAWLAAVLCAPWLQRGMKDLYWCLWLWWLPALAGLWLCAATRRRGRTPRSGYALLALACLLRCLCGFEFISVYLILCEIPLVYCWAVCLSDGDRAAARRWVGRMTAAGAAALGGVAAAMAVWLVQSRLYFGGWAAAARNLAGAVAQRVSLSDGGVRAVTVPQVLYKYLLADPTPLLQLGPLPVTLPVLAGVCLAALAACALLLARRDRAALRALAPLAAVWALSLLAPVSWLVLSKAHADIHTHLIPMLWHFAFVPVSCALLATLARRAAAALRGAGRRGAGAGGRCR